MFLVRLDFRKLLLEVLDFRKFEFLEVSYFNVFGENFRKSPRNLGVS